MLSGGTQVVVSGGIIDGATISSGELELLNGATAGSTTISFAGGGTLQLDGTGAHGFLVAGFAEPDAFDLSAISFASATKPYAGDTSSGTLTVGDGTNSVPSCCSATTRRRASTSAPSAAGAPARW
jgi:autotransporter passenger strand-loop-strand repeat protein